MGGDEVVVARTSSMSTLLGYANDGNCRMLHRGIRFAYAIVMIASFAIAFVVMRNMDETTVRGASYTVSLDATNGGASVTRVANMVQDFSRSHRVNIGRLYYDPLNDSIRHVYLAVGDLGADSSRWLTRGYPHFSREAKVEVHQYQEIAETVPPDGLYLVFGSSQEAVDLLRAFAQLGYGGETEQPRSAGRWAQYLGRDTTLSCLLVAGLMAMVTSASAVALNAKSYAVQRLQGRTFAEILWQDLKQLARFNSAAFAAIGMASISLLYSYNNLGQLGSYILVSALLLGAYAFSLLLTHIVTLTLVHRGSILDAIKGELSSAWSIVGAYVLRCWGLLLILSISATAVTSGVKLSEQHERYQTWSALGNAYYIRLAGSVENPHVRSDAERRIARWVRESDARNDVSLASRQRLPESGRELLVVNDRYLAKQDIFASSGAREQPGIGDSLRVLIPQHYSDDETKRIENEAIDWLSSTTVGALPQVRTERVRDNQRALFYTNSLGNNAPMLKEPIVVVVAGSSGVISDDTYVTMASQGALLVEDPKRAAAALAGVGASDYVLGFSPFTQDASDGFRDAKRDFGMDIVNLIAGLAVLAITAFGVSIVYCRRNSQKLFVKYISGWTFVCTHWRILLIEFAIGLILVLWAWHTSASMIDMYESPWASLTRGDELLLASLQPVLATGADLANLVIIGLTLRRANVKFLKARSATLS